MLFSLYSALSLVSAYIPDTYYKYDPLDARFEDGIGHRSTIAEARLEAGLEAGLARRAMLDAGLDRRAVLDAGLDRRAVLDTGLNTSLAKRAALDRVYDRPVGSLASRKYSRLGYLD